MTITIECVKKGKKMSIDMKQKRATQNQLFTKHADKQRMQHNVGIRNQ